MTSSTGSRLPLLADEFGSFPMPGRNPTNWTLEQPHRRSVRSVPLRETNRTEDISGAAPGTTAIFRSSRYTHKPQSLGLMTQDIDGARPGPLHGVRDFHGSISTLKSSPSPAAHEPAQPAVVADYAIQLSSSPHRNKTATINPRSQRSVNPLNPQYVLPSLHPSGVGSAFDRTGSSLLNHSASSANNNALVPRDVLLIDDIPGTRSKKVYTRSVERSPLYTDDIPKRYLPVHRSQRNTTLNLVTDDILHPQDLPQRAARGTNPNSPVYQIVTYPEGATENLYRWSPPQNGKKGIAPSSILVSIGKIDGSEPKKPKPLRNDQPLLSLRTEDVDGAKPGNPYKTKM